MLKEGGFGDAPVCRCWTAPHGTTGGCPVHPSDVSKAAEPPVLRHARLHLEDAKKLRALAPDSRAIAAVYTAQANATRDPQIKRGCLMLAKRAEDEATSLETQASDLEKAANAALAAGKASEEAP